MLCGRAPPILSEINLVETTSRCDHDLLVLSLLQGQGHILMKPIHEKSSVIRTKLPEFLTEAASGKRIAIELNNTVVAWLGSSELSVREQGIPPIFLSAKEAKDDWSAILDAVVTSGAYYGFKNKKDGGVVILVPDDRNRHKRVKEWQEHVLEHQISINNGESGLAGVLEEDIRDVQDEVRKVHDAIKCVFRLIEKRVSPNQCHERAYELEHN